MLVFDLPFFAVMLNFFFLRGQEEEWWFSRSTAKQGLTPDTNGTLAVRKNYSAKTEGLTLVFVPRYHLGSVHLVEFAVL